MDFVVERNIARFRKLLETEADPAKRATLETLLRAEEAKILNLPGPTQTPPPSGN